MKRYRLIAFPAGDWYEVRCDDEGYSVYEGHSRGEAFEAIVKDAGLVVDEEGPSAQRAEFVL